MLIVVIYSTMNYVKAKVGTVWSTLFVLIYFHGKANNDE